MSRMVWIFFLLGGFFIACHSPEENADKETPTRTSVTVIHPTTQPLTQYLELNGITQYQRKETIRATATGYLSSLKILPGNSVHEDEVLATISTKEQRALQPLDSAGIKSLIKPLSVSSSASGIVTTLNYRNGDYVSEGDVIATIAEPSSLVILLNVPFEYRNIAHAGINCEIALPDGTKSTGRIDQALPQVDAVSQTQTMMVRINNSSSLPENMNVIIRIPQITKANALCVLKSVVQTNETQTEFWVMKVVNDSLARKVNVQPGLIQDSIQEIISPQISPDDWVINSGAYELPDSSIVIVHNKF